MKKLAEKNPHCITQKSTNHITREPWKQLIFNKMILISRFFTK